MATLPAVKGTKQTVAWSNLIAIWADPGTVFLRMRNQWAWFPAWFGIGGCLMISQLLILDRLHQLSQDTLQAVSADHVTITLASWALRINTVLGPIIQPLLRAFVMALSISAIATALQVKHRFGKIYALSMWTLLPSLGLSNLFRSIILTLKPTLPLTGVRSDFLYFISADGGSWTRMAVAATDFFFLWSIVLIATGFVIIQKCSPRRGCIMGISLLITWVGVSLAWT